MPSRQTRTIDRVSSGANGEGSAFVEYAPDKSKADSSSRRSSDDKSWYVGSVSEVSKEKPFDQSADYLIRPHTTSILSV
jgi:hypothetical protein